MTLRPRPVTIGAMTVLEIVTLRRPFEGLPAGASGRLIGFSRRPGGDLAVVSFAGRVESVPVSLLASADDT